MQTDTKLRTQWSSYLDYILVTTGAVIGLGNIFNFPYLALKYGATFVLFYVIFELLLGIPILLAEIIIGRRGKLNPVDAIYILALEANRKLSWRFIGWLCFIILLSMLCFYSISAAYPLAYFASTVSNWVAHLSSATPLTDMLNTNPWLLLGFFLIFIAVAFSVTARGINRGLENICRIIIPLIFLIMLALAIYSCSIGNAKAALISLVVPNFSTINFTVIFAAFAYAFFKLNVGMGCMIVYGSYLPLVVPLGRSALTVALMDVILSLLAYFTLAPLMLLAATNLQTTSFAYQAIPALFAPAQPKFMLTVLFFLAVVLAAWMPTIAFAETVTVTVTELFRITRRHATAIIAGTIAVIGGIIIFVSSSSVTSSWNLRLLAEKATTDILIPISALLIAIFVGWKMRTAATESELGFSRAGYLLWLFLIRFIAPIGILFLLAKYLISMS